MKLLPKIFSLPVLVILAWMGANIYHGNDLFANPFEEQSVLDKMESRGSNFFDDTLEDAGDAAKDSFKEGVDNIGDAIKDIAE
jgi:hypothetical protein